jgi:hypothetical protein
MAKDKDYEIIVNATPHVVEQDKVTFNQILDLAFPGRPNNPDIVYSVTFDNAQHPHSGILSEGGAVEVKKKNTVFDVTQTNRS